MKRILFVDDATDVLEGLERMLRSQRREWNMAFADSGEKALSAMAVEPFDVVVTDVKMPDMNGVELLERIRARYPRTVRMVLSGHSAMETSMRSMFVCHQFLEKPFDANALRTVLGRACGLKDLVQEPSLQAALGSITELPVLPRVYEALTDALARPEVDIQELGRLVERDLGLAAKVLQLVNSSFVGIRREITDVRRATTHIGITAIRNLVRSSEMLGKFESIAKLSGFSMEREQRHSRLTARIARRLLDDKTLAQEAFLAAMFHDVGKLVLATHVAEPFQAILQAGAGANRPFRAVEEEVLGVSHAEVGAYLLGLWGMSSTVVTAVAHHHHPALVPDQAAFGVLGATHVAECLARELEGCDPATVELDEQYLQALGVAEKLPEWRAIAADETGSESSASRPVRPAGSCAR